jgi:uncharacterized RDD family membrane protein YckC
MSGGQGTSALPHVAEAFQGKPAGLVTRSVAAVIDLLVVAATMLAAYGGTVAVLFVWNPRSFSPPDASSLLTITTAYVFAVVYLTAGWWIAGRTYGCGVMGLRVVGRHGRKVSFPRAFVRAVVCSLVPIGLGWCAVDGGGRALHDLVAGTRVVYDWRSGAE